METGRNLQEIRENLDFDWAKMDIRMAKVQVGKDEFLRPTTQLCQLKLS